MRVLVAGVGNELRGDDGFGIEALRSLERDESHGVDVRYFESGIAGIGLVQQLMDGFDALIIDALDRAPPRARCSSSSPNRRPWPRRRGR
ncbi:MAG: hypothetical protein WKF75_12185 [Singulisphaera sp.]